MRTAQSMATSGPHQRGVDDGSNGDTIVLGQSAHQRPKPASRDPHRGHHQYLKDTAIAHWVMHDAVQRRKVFPRSCCHRASQDTTHAGGSTFQRSPVIDSTSGQRHVRSGGPIIGGNRNDESAIAIKPADSSTTNMDR